MAGRSKLSEQHLPFFVYGTLLPGQPNSLLWQGLETNVRRASLANGRLYDMGGYPMLVEMGASSVSGQLITIASDFYPIVMARLDFLEGFDPRQSDSAGYRRVIRPASCENGRFTSAWVYVGQIELVNGRPPIPNGDWVAYCQPINTDLTSSSTPFNRHSF